MRLLAGMRPFMRFESPFLRKTVRALLAFVGLFTAMRPYVEQQTLFPLKGFSARVTGKVRGVTMNPLVTVQDVP